MKLSLKKYFSDNKVLCSVLGLTALICIFILHPWQRQFGQSVLSWDAFGYYLYLPSVFIYHDLTLLKFIPAIFNHYQPSNYFYGAMQVNGNWVMGYTMGLSILQLPFFFLGHITALLLGFPSDGFSQPYQFWIYVSGIVYTSAGILILNFFLRNFFEKKVALIAVLLIALGTNLFYYGFFENALTHNYLFFLYACLLHFTFQFHREQKFKAAVYLGVTLGLLVLVRPSESIAVLIPVLWNVYSLQSLKEKFSLILKNYMQLFVTGILVVVIFSIQLFYWKLTTGNFLFNPYESVGLGFDWKSPHFVDLFFSFRKGWMIYTPLIAVAFIGIPFFIFKKNLHELKAPLLIFLLLNIYILCAWQQWWYGGSFGQRSMVQSYALWIFPLAAFLEWSKKYFRNWIFILLLPLVFVNFYFTSLYYAGAMPTDYLTKQRLQEIALHPHRDLCFKNLLAEKINLSEKIVYQNDFENDSLAAEDPQNSSNHCGMLYSGNEFAGNWKMKVADVPHASVLSGITASVKVFSVFQDPYFLNDVNLVFECKNQYGDDRKWVSKSAASFWNSDSANYQWHTLTLTTALPATAKPTDEISVYIWLTGKSTVLIDDFKIEWVAEK